MSALLLSVLVALTALAQAMPIKLAKESKLWIEGDSNFHPWSCSAKTVAAVVGAEESAAAQPARSLALRVPVTDLDCGSGFFNGKLRDALKSDEHPAIEYRLISTERMAGEGVVLQVTGALTIAGRTRRVTFVVEAATGPDGSVYAMGTVPLLMSDFGVEPPSAMLGALKAYDPLTVRFELHTLPQVAASIARR